MNEQFIELFDTDLITLPSFLPEWFHHQDAMFEEERKERNLLSANGKLTSTGIRVHSSNRESFFGPLGENEEYNIGEALPGYMKYYYCGEGPLLSSGIIFDRKKSLCDDEDD